VVLRDRNTDYLSLVLMVFLDRSGCRCCNSANWFKALSVKGYNASKVNRRKASVLCVMDEQISCTCSEEETRTGVVG
jgi:hypothetical protein